MLSISRLALVALFSLAAVYAMASGNKDVIVSFQKTASDEDRESVVKQLQEKGAKIVKDENKHSKIMPFVVVNLSEQHFADVQSSFAGHDVVKHVEEDGVMRTQ